MQNANNRTNDSDMDFRKKLLINEFKQLSAGKKSDEMLPLIMALRQKACQANIQFTKEDIKIVIDQFQKDISPAQLKLLSELLVLMEPTKRT